MKITERTEGRWRTLLPRVGVDSKLLSGKQQACPGCGGKDRFRFDDKFGKGDYYCNQCGRGDGFKLLEMVKGWDFATAAREIEAIIGEVPKHPPKGRMNSDTGRRLSRSLWGECLTIQPGDEAHLYLANRGHAAPPGGALRFHPACPVSGVDGVTTLPALVALVRDANGDGDTLHRTYLRDGAKAPIDSPRRLMPGGITKGGAIRLMPHKGELGVAEGIETALAVWRDFGIPCWSTISEGLLGDFIWPTDITKLHVFGDNDLNFVGQAAAYQLAKRASVHRNPVPVEVHIPPVPGTDWDDHGRLARAA
jgi:putative DNA primase/helicase